MSLSKRYIDYLDHFGKAVTLNEFASSDSSNIVGLRHDIDYNIDLAMEMSFWEHEKGVQSTYYILHTAEYWKDPKLIDKLLQIQDFGHEIGLHLNFLTEWYLGINTDISGNIASILGLLRSNGINVTGCSAHGDPNCYQYNYNNSWLFKELRTDHPDKYYAQRNAEGTVSKPFDKVVKYPNNHMITNLNGHKFGLWEYRLSDFGLSYEAVHLIYDKYFSDSGGEFKRTPDPIQEDLSSGRSQVLIHPEHWKGPQNKFFFMSCARSGSKWLANVLDKGTSVKGVHEFTLNNRYKDNELIKEKNTGVGFVDLLADENRLKDLLSDSIQYIESNSDDYAESNIYLESILPKMKLFFPDSKLIHLYRKPENVVRSIKNRDWYETSDDSRHPRVDIEGWDEMSQFVRCCLYVKATNENLLNSCEEMLGFEKMVSSIDYLTSVLTRIGIAVYPRLLDEFYNNVVNENTSYEFPEYANWSNKEKDVFNAICGLTREKLGYANEEILYGFQKYAYFFHKMIFGAKKQVRKPKNETIDLRSVFTSKKWQHLESIEDLSYNKVSEEQMLPSGTRCSISIEPECIKCVPDGEGHAFVLLGGGLWGKNLSNGWESGAGMMYKGNLDASIEEGKSFTLFVLMYGSDGKLIEKISLGLMHNQLLPVDFSFKPRPNVSRFNLALFMNSSALPSFIQINGLLLDKFQLV